MRDHRLIDQRSLAFGRAVADHLRRNPDLIRFGRENIRRWTQTASPRLLAAFDEWTQILHGPVNDVITILTATDERAIRLRQSNPFAGILSNAERNAILREFEAHDQAAT